MLISSAETDWLASRPVFYNDNTNLISYDISEVIDYNNISFHPEGLRNYLKYGYCVLGQTPFENVKFLRFSSKIWLDDNGKITIEEFEDPVKKRIEEVGSSEHAISMFRESVSKWERECGQIVLPLSGGYDSKFLLSLITDKDKVKAFSYGFSKKQYDSFEVVRAQKVAEAYGIKWKHVLLSDFLKYIPEWYDQYGASVHAHGMYQIDFYNKIAQEIKPQSACVLSGIIGDVWAGNARFTKVSSADELETLSYSHGMAITKDICLLPDDRDITYSFWNEHKEELEDENWRIVYAMRMKIMLLRYLLQTPLNEDFSVWTPFLDIDNAMSMLTIPWEEKQDRLWQKRFFENQHIEYGWLKKECDYNMVLDESGLRLTRLEPLNEKLLGKIVDKKFVEHINKTLSTRPFQSFSARPKTIPNIINKGIKKLNGPKIDALYSYEILYPLQRVMEKSF